MKSASTLHAVLYLVCYIYVMIICKFLLNLDLTDKQL